MKKLIYIFATILIASTSFSIFAQQMSPDRQKKAMADLDEIGQCIGLFNVYVKNGGEPTEGNRKYFQKHIDIDPFMKKVIASVDGCRNSNPSNPGLHEACANKLMPAENALYMGFLKGNAKMNSAYRSGDKTKVGVYALSCSL